MLSDGVCMLTPMLSRVINTTVAQTEPTTFEVRP